MKLNWKIKLHYLNNLKKLPIRKNVSDRDIHAIIHGSEHEHNAIFST